MPLNQLAAEGLGHFDGEHRLAGAGFAFDQQRALQSDGSVDGDTQVVSCHIVFSAFETHGYPVLVCLSLTIRSALTGASSDVAGGVFRTAAWVSFFAAPGLW